MAGRTAGVVLSPACCVGVSTMRLTFAVAYPCLALVSVMQARDEVSCEGARALWVTFDPRCQLSERATLTFFADKSYRSALKLT